MVYCFDATVKIVKDLSNRCHFGLILISFLFCFSWEAIYIFLDVFFREAVQKKWTKLPGYPTSVVFTFCCVRVWYAQVVAVAVLLCRHQMLWSRVWPPAAQEELHPVQVEGPRTLSDVEKRQTRRSACLLWRSIFFVYPDYVKWHCFIAVFCGTTLHAGTSLLVPCLLLAVVVLLSVCFLWQINVADDDDAVLTPY